MSANPAAVVLSFLAAVMLTAAAAACSDDSPDPDAAAQSDATATQDAKDPDTAASANAGSPQSNASDPADQAPAPAQTEAVEILQSDNRFITIALSRYRSSISDIDPDALNPWCTHPDAENIVVPPKQRTSPPVPAYLPQGVSLHNQISHPDGRYYGDTYVSGDGNGDHIRLRVLHSTCLITNSDPALIEQVDVGGSWGVFVTGLEGATSFDLHFETDLGVVTIQRVITGGKEESVGKDELVRIAESMPVFAGEAAAPAQTEAVDILQSDNRFITIALSRYWSSISDIDPDALNPWCTHPDAENIVVPPKQRTSPPVPAYLPQGVSLHNQISHPDGRYYGDTYVSGDGNGDHIRLRVLHSTCLITNSDPGLIEQVDVGGNWGVFVTGLEGATSFDLHFETDLGVVTIQRVITGGKEESVGKAELVRIAESMPVFAGEAATPAQTEAVDILQSDNRFITIALSRYRSSISDIDPDALNPWCTHPDAENIVVPPKQRTSPPVPAYLPQGVSLHNQISHPDGRYYGDTYVSGDGNGDHIRLRVLHSTCLITNSDPALIEQVDVGGSWGVFVTGLKGATSFDLHFETDLGVVTIQRVVTGGKEESVGKSELVRIAESMPVFAGEAAYRIHRLDASASADDAQPETGFIISPLGFVKVGVGESVDDVYPPGLHERCTSPGPGYPPPISAVSPPVPAYLPADVSLERKSYTPGGAHIGDTYVGIDGERITVRSGACGAVFAPPGLWEPISVAGAWSILVQGACVVDGDSGIYSVEDGLPDCWKPNAALNLTMETEAGFVEIRSVNIGVNQNSVGKDDLVQIAESMPVFAFGGG